MYNISSDSDPNGTGAQFNATLFLDSSHNRISLLAAQIPRSWPLIRSGDNILYLDSTPYTLTPGSYSATALATYITSLISPSVLSFSLVSSRNTLTSSASTISVPSPRLRRILGLAATTTAIGGAVTFQNCVFCTSCSQVWVCTNLVQNDSVGDAVGSALSHIFVCQAPDQSLIAYQNAAPRESSRALNVTQGFSSGGAITCQFKLLDSLEESLDLQGLPVDLVISTWREDPSVYSLLYEWSHLWVKLKREEVQAALPPPPPPADPNYLQQQD